MRSLFFLSLREFAANSFFNLVITAGFLIYVLNAHPEPLGALNVVGFLGLLLVGVLLHWALGADVSDSRVLDACRDGAA